MTLAEIRRTIRAAIRAARQEGAPVVEVTIDDVIVRIPLAPDDKSLAEPRPNSFDRILDGRG